MSIEEKEVKKALTEAVEEITDKDKWERNGNGYEYLKQRLIQRFEMSSAAVDQMLKGLGISRVIQILAEDKGLIDQLASDNLDKLTHEMMEARKASSEKLHQLNAAETECRWETQNAKTKAIQLDREKEAIKRERELLKWQEQELAKDREKFQEEKEAWRKTAASDIENVTYVPPEPCETREARDQMKKAEMFRKAMKEIEMGSKDQTAYITGLASILAGSTGRDEAEQLKETGT